MFPRPKKTHQKKKAKHFIPKRKPPLLDPILTHTFSWTRNEENKSPVERSQHAGVKIVCISDTHGDHRKLEMPEGDILIHAGDYTNHGKRHHVVDFNEWLGELSYKHIVVVQGNHEHNAPWKNEAKDLISNATLLLHEMVELQLEVDSYDSECVDTRMNQKNNIKFNIFGTAFSWPVRGQNPYLDSIDDSVDIIVAHGPAKGFVDKAFGCPALLNAVNRVNPKLVISGHIHGGRGIATSDGGKITFVNAANASDSHTVEKQPIVLHVMM